jgi:hypothetical protein
MAPARRTCPPVLRSSRLLLRRMDRYALAGGPPLFAAFFWAVLLRPSHPLNRSLLSGSGPLRTTAGTQRKRPYQASPATVRRDGRGLPAVARAKRERRLAAEVPSIAFRNGRRGEKKRNTYLFIILNMADCFIQTNLFVILNNRIRMRILAYSHPFRHY